MSSSINSPSDFASHGHYYSSSVDSTKNTDSSGIKPPTSRYKLTNSEEVASPVDTSEVMDGTPTKKDSLTRRAAYGRRGTGGGLKRSSVVSSDPNTEAEKKAESVGVQLEDKPMDFD